MERTKLPTNTPKRVIVLDDAPQDSTCAMEQEPTLRRKPGRPKRGITIPALRKTEKVDAPTFSDAQKELWKDGSSGFFKWLEDIQPRVPSSNSGFEIFYIATFQREFIRSALQRKRNSDFYYQTILLSFPRRHSKTTLNALLCLWRLTTREGEDILAIANSERQMISVGFGLCKKIAQQTPYLRDFLGVRNIQANQIICTATNSLLRTGTSNPATLYGSKLSCAWLTEVHASRNDDALQVLASSLGDTKNSWLLLDSTTDVIGGTLHRYEQLASSGEDKTIFVGKIEYKNLEEALEKCPSWISKDWLKSRAKQLLPSVFAQQHLNQRVEAQNSLFRRIDIAKCQYNDLPLVISPEQLQAITDGRNHVVGLGLDRAYSFTKNGDKTILTTIAKVASSDPTEDCHYYILNQENIFGSLGRIIKQSVSQAYEDWSFHNIIFESYNSGDLYTWAIERNYPSEVVHASATNQQAPFLELQRIISEHRLHFSIQNEELKKELENFVYEIASGNIIKFGSNAHDDYVYSLCWAIHATRQQELYSYVLDELVCNSKSKHARHCYLLSEQGLILPCSTTCTSQLQVQKMFTSYTKSHITSTLTLQEFYDKVVRAEDLIAIV